MSKRKMGLGQGKLGHGPERYQAARMQPVVQRRGTQNNRKPKGSTGGKLRG